MWFGGVRSGAEDREGILERSLVHNGGLLKHEDGTHVQKELLPQGIADDIQGSKEKGSFKRTFIC